MHMQAITQIPEVPAAARTDDEIERHVQDLATLLPAAALDRLTLDLCGEDPGYRGQGALAAALAFQRRTLADLRSGRLDRGVLRRAVAGLQPPGGAPAPLFDRAFFLFGIRRSGNHALVEWLSRHFAAGEVLFLNSAEPALFEGGPGRLRVDGHKYGQVVPSALQRCLIVSYENCDPAVFPFAWNARVAHRADALLLLRDYPNNAASIARSARDRPAFAYRFRVRDFPDLWCRYARLVLDGCTPLRPVLFNRWVGDAGERAALSAALGLARSPEVPAAISPIGGGSSFDGLSRDGRAATMDVLRRWPVMLDDPLFRFLMLADETVPALNDALFGPGFPDRDALLSAWRHGA
ncbi:hypothetical protein [Niveispirillum fermenti]|uniref:hypothetical protein n=1 Tax=Niveispirillum fermenti TaxID=1233113 RepID=UPI003A8C55AE